MKPTRIIAGLVFTLIMAGFIATATGLPFEWLFPTMLALGAVNKLPKGALANSITYPSDCDDADPIHECSDCEDVELGRIRGIGFLKDGTTIADRTSAADYISAIEAGNLIIIPLTRGSFDGGTPKEGPGYGDQATKYIGTDYSLTFFDPAYASNRDFYNTIKRYQNYKILFKTETLVHFTDKNCQVLPKAPVQDDPNSEVVWEVMVKWTSQNEPTNHACPSGVFICFDVEAN